MDYLNGFCTVRRSKILKELMRRKDYAKIAFFLQWYAEDPGVLFHHENGEVETLSVGQGVDQGGALSPFFFSIAVHGVLEEINKMDGVHVAMGFLDDLFMTTSPETSKVLTVDGKVDALLEEEETGLKVNPGKTVVFDPWSELREGRDEDLEELLQRKVETGGIEILGAPLCGQDTGWLNDFLAVKVAGLKPLLERVTFLEPQHAFHVLRHCVSSKLNYLWRSVPSHIAAGYASQADDLIWETICSILAVPEDPDMRASMGFNLPRARRIMFLPTGMGGGGFNSASRSIAGACTAGISAALKGVDTACRDWWVDVLVRDDLVADGLLPLDIREVKRGFKQSVADVAAITIRWHEADIQRFAPEALPPEFVGTLPNSVEAAIESWVQGSGAVSQQRLARIWSVVEWVDVWKGLPLQLRAILRSQSAKGAHNHLLALPAHQYLYLRPEEVLFMFRSITFLPLSNFVIPVEWLDGKKDVLTDTFLQFRYLLRDADRAITHTAMISVLREMLSAVGIPVQMEKAYSTPDSDGSYGRVDFLERILSFVGKTTAYDFTSVSVDTAPRAAEASKDVGSVAEEIEARKCRENGALCAKEGWDFSPLGMEEPGNFGEGLKNLIQKCERRAVDYPESIPMGENWASPDFKTFWSQALRVRMVKCTRARWAAVLAHKLRV
jgi:hypothetical protein